MPVPNLRPAAKFTTPEPKNNIIMAQDQPLWHDDPCFGHATSQVLNAMQAQGWSIVYPQEAPTISRVCAVMIGKLSRHST